MTDEPSPLLAVDDDAVAEAFAADPLTLTDAKLATLVTELRRRRNAFLSSEAAKSLKKQDKKEKVPAPTAEQQAKLDKPPSELTVEDIFGDD